MNLMSSPGFARGVWRACLHPAACGVVMALFLACAPSAAVLPLEIRLGPPKLTKTVPEAEKLKTAVAPFEDSRRDTSHIGMRRDWLGTDTPLTIQGGPLGEMLAEMLVEQLRHRYGWDSWIAKRGVIQPDGGPDVTWYGTVVAFRAEAVPHFGGTRLTATVGLRLKGQRASDQRSLVLEHEMLSSKWVFWFESGDLEILLHATVRRTLEHLLSQAVVDGRSLRIQ